MDNDEFGFRLLTLRRTGESGLAGGAVIIEEFGETQLRGLGRQTGDILLNHFPSWKPALIEQPKVFLQPTDHNRIEVAFEDLYSAGKSLRVEQFE
jgi:hypothetical protein